MTTFAECEVQRNCGELMFEILFPKEMRGKERLKQLRLNVERRLTSLGYLPRSGYRWVVRKDHGKQRLCIESERVTFSVVFAPIPPTSEYFIVIGVTYNEMVGKQLEPVDYYK